jgi:myo-inositol-1-phosphate synthase
MQINRETKTETIGPILMYDAAGQEYAVRCTVHSYRQQLQDGRWTNWHVATRMFMCGQTPVDVADDGWYKLPFQGTLIRPRQEG